MNKFVAAVALWLAAFGMAAAAGLDSPAYIDGKPLFDTNTVLACTAACDPQVQTNGQATVVMSATGTGASLAFVAQGTVDGTNWTTLAAFNEGTQTSTLSSLAANGSWVISAGGYTYVRAHVTGLASGTETFTLNASVAAHGLIITAMPAVSVSVTNPTVGAAFPSTANAVGFSQGGNLVAATGTSGNLNVNCASGCSGSNPNGQATMANSAPVVIASNQSSIGTKGDELSDTTGTFTNGTQTTSVTSSGINGYDTALITINGTYGTATAVFEGSDDGGTTFYPLQAARSDGTASELGYTTLTNTNRAWVTPINGMDQVRVRSSAVASGTVNVRISILSQTSAAAATNSLSGYGAGVDTNSGAASANTLRVIQATGATTAITAASGSVASGAIASGAYASGALAAGSISDGADVTQGAKADAKSTATDTTSISIMSVLKEISSLEQAPASRAVTNAGTFAAQATLQTQTDTVMVGGVNVKEINGVTPLMGNGVTGTGSPRMTLSSDNTTLSNVFAAVKIDQTTPGTTNAVQEIPGTTGGLSTYVVEPGASDNHANIKNGAGQVYGMLVTTKHTAAQYMRLYDAGTGFNGCNSATNLKFETIVPASSTAAGFTPTIPAGLAFGTGISICFTGAYGNTDTTSATASVSTVNVFYK